MGLEALECIYFSSCKEYINNLKYYVKHNKINKLIIQHDYDNPFKLREYKYIFHNMNNMNRLKISNRSLLYLNKSIFNYIYKYGFKYKTIFETCQIISAVINLKKIFSNRKLNSSLSITEKIFDLGYYVNFAKYLKRKKSKSYLIVNDYLAKYIQNDDAYDVLYFEYKYCLPIDNIDRHKYKYQICNYLNKYKLMHSFIFNLINLNCLISNKKINDICSLLLNYEPSFTKKNADDGIIKMDSFLCDTINFIFEELLFHGIVYDNFNEFAIFIKFICDNRDIFSIKCWFNFINIILNFIDIHTYSNVKPKNNTNKLLYIEYNLYICKNKHKNKLQHAIDLFNNIYLYNAIYPLISDTYFYQITNSNNQYEKLCTYIIKYLNIHEKHYNYLFNKTLILKTIKNKIIEENIVDTIEFNNILDVEKNKIKVFNPTYKFDLY